MSPQPDTVVFTLARNFAAPLDRVWAAWTRPELLARWYGPKGAETTILGADLRPGGLLHGRMETPGVAGAGFRFRFLYREIVPPSVEGQARLAWIQSFADEAGEIAPSPFGEPWPRRLLTEVTFREAADGRSTHVDLIWSPLDATGDEQAAFAAETTSMTGGWTGSFARLDAALAE